MLKSTVVAAGLLILLMAGCAGEPAGEVDLDAEAQVLESMLVASCCWRQPVSDHPSPTSTEMQQEIRRMLQGGMTRQAILDQYVKEYGERILSVPPQRGFNRLVYVMPVIFLAVGFVTTGLVIRHMTRGAEATAPAAAEDRGGVEPETGPGRVLRERIERELDQG